MKRRQARDARDLARQRIERLFELAEEEHILHPERSDRYVQIARRISTRLRIRMLREQKRLFCRHCGSYLSPSASKIRLRDGFIVVTCNRCSGLRKYPIKRANKGE